MGTADAISASMADREKRRLLVPQRGLGYLWLGVSVIVALAIAFVVIARMPL